MVEAGSQRVALALQPRMSDLNRRRLIPVIERVLREMDVPGRQVRIERLVVDLGEVPLSELDRELPRLLEHDLRRAVAAALRGEDREAGVRARPVEQARAELLEHHLLRGTLPFWAPPGTSLASLVDEMAAQDAGRLADVVRRLGTRPRVLHRLVAQLSERGLARLVRVLEPQHAALVVAYVFDLRRVHRRQPLLPLSDRRFGRELWTLVQTYLVHDPGTGFNRRSFVRSLLRGMSRGQGLDYAALLATLARGLERTRRRRRPAGSSLPAVVGELLREEGIDALSASPFREPPSSTDAKRAIGVEADDGADDTHRHRSADLRPSTNGERRRVGWDAENAAVDSADRDPSADPHLSDIDRARRTGMDADDAADSARRDRSTDPRASGDGRQSALDADDAVDDARRSSGDSRLPVNEPGQQAGPAADDARAVDASDRGRSADPRSSARDADRRSAADADDTSDAASRRPSSAATLSSAPEPEQQRGSAAIHADDAIDADDAAGPHRSTGLRPSAGHRGRRTGIDAEDTVDAADPVVSPDSRPSGAGVRPISTDPDGAVDSDHSSADVPRPASNRDGQSGLDAADAVDSADRDASADPWLSTSRRGLRRGMDAADAENSARRDPSADPHLSAERGLQGGVDADDALDAAKLDASARNRPRRIGSGGEEDVGAKGGSDRASASGPSGAGRPIGRASASRASAAGREDADRAARGAERRAFARYDAAEAAGYLLRHGVLPWGALLRDPALDEAGVLAALPRLPRTLLHEALRADGPDERRRMVDALARGVEEDDLARLLVRVIPAAGAGSGPFRDSLRAFTGAAADRRAFLARVLCAALDGDPLDLETLAADAGGIHLQRPAELAAWPPHLLMSMLTDALRAGPARTRAHPTPAALLAALAGAHPADAHHSLRALAGDPRLATALVRAAAPPLHDRLVELLAPAAAKTARALHAALAALPPPHRRPGDDEQREVVLAELMRLREGQAPGEAFFARVLERLFGARLPEAAGERLLAAADAWARPGALPAAHAAAFRAAVTAALARAEGVPSATGPASAATDPAEGRDARRARRQAVFAFLLGRPLPATAADGALSSDALRHLLQRMMDEAPEELAAFLRRHSTSRHVRERWARVLPEPTLARMARVLAPRHHATLVAAAELLHDAWRAVAPSAHLVGGRPALWSFVVEFLARGGGAGRPMDRLVAAFFASRAARVRGVLPAPEPRLLGERLLDAAVRATVARGQARLHAALHRQRGRLLDLWDRDAPSTAGSNSSLSARNERGGAGGGASRTELGRHGPTRPGRPSRRPPAHGHGHGHGGGGEEDGGEPVYVGNAGLVLAAPYLPHLFRRLGLLHEEDGAEPRPGLRDAEAVSRGVHVLQYLVDGRTRTPEHELALNKVLCGVPLATPVDASIELSDEERATCDHLLAAIITNWGAIPGTSVAGLRETFLQREGRLVERDGAWRLTVQRKTLDLLVDRLPWSISVILHPWMPMRLHVTW